MKDREGSVYYMKFLDVDIGLLGSLGLEGRVWRSFSIIGRRSIESFLLRFLVVVKFLFKVGRVRKFT